MGVYQGPEDEYTPAEIADRLGVTRRTIYRWIKAGYLPSVKLGPKLVYVRQSALQRFLEGSHAPVPPSQAAAPREDAHNGQPTLPPDMLPTGSGRIIPAPRQNKPQKGNKRRP
jgi:excisionase family DNA binding protein